jgi:putative selenate reductase
MLIHQIDSDDQILGVYKELFFYPHNNDSFRKNRFGKLLESPIGVAAGPHTQLAQNIVMAWLTGARFIELKTVQTLDKLEISKPCIDMQDEGYNCEWSQELKIKQSFNEYVNAWILIHILKDKLKIGSPKESGFVFNMSVGYDLNGIMQENVQWFFDKMKYASQEIEQKKKELEEIYPNIVNLNISNQLSDNITLSTMHGCPPHEIQQIAEYLISERKLHTSVKLNPTLLGEKDLRNIIQNSGFTTHVPDKAFKHDLKFDDAIGIIQNLRDKAKENNVHFSLKLTNTLESVNHKNVFPKKEKMMYGSGKLLHPISVNVARKLSNELNGEVDISFSGGIDALNVRETLETGLFPVTVCSDLLKPGGYGRLSQYIEDIKEVELPEMIKIEQLNSYADSVLKDTAYRKKGFKDQSIKTGKQLNYFDCHFAPCEITCPTHQDIPSYMHFTAHGEFEKAYAVIKETNPFPNSTGMICDHKCQTKCTRINYDSPLLIRDIKRFISETYTNSKKTYPEEIASKINKKVSIIGAGPSGLTCAYYLNKAGFDVEIFEAKKKSGGMVSAAVPKFRLSDEAIDIDIRAIENSGVQIHYSTKVATVQFEMIKEQSDFVYIAAGAQNAYTLNIEGSDHPDVLDPLEFLYSVKDSQSKTDAVKIVVIGGGNTAMDAVRTAHRIVPEVGSATLVYRRTLKQMPAEYKEIKDVIDEGIDIIELASPLKVIIENNKIKALRCIKMKLGEPDESGREKPVEIPGSEFDISCDTIIPAIGQSLAIDFTDKKNLVVKGNSYETKLENVFIGGDALRNASTLIHAVADGRKAANQILTKAGILTEQINSVSSSRIRSTAKELMLKKVKREKRLESEGTIQTISKIQIPIPPVMTEKEAMQEASRCLMCDELCQICVTLCPNLALQAYTVESVRYKLQKVKNNTIAEDIDFRINQHNQIIHIADWCNQCGNCNTFCPTANAPYKEKPHFYFDRQSFEHDQAGYFYDHEQNTLFAKEAGFDYSLHANADTWIYKNDHFIAKINKKDFKIIEFTGASDDEHSLVKAAQMSLIIESAKKFY